MYFATNVSYSSLPAYLPTILKDMGYSNINAQGLSAPPYFVAFLCALSTTWLADRTQQRGLVVMATSCVGGIGYIILATVDKVAVRYFATFLAASGVFATIPNILAWMLSKYTTFPGTADLLTITRQSRKRFSTRRRFGSNPSYRSVRSNSRDPVISHS